MSDEDKKKSVGDSSVTLYAGFEAWRLKKLLENIPDNAVIDTDGKSVHIQRTNGGDQIKLSLD